MITIRLRARGHKSTNNLQQIPLANANLTHLGCVSSANAHVTSNPDGAAYRYESISPRTKRPPERDESPSFPADLRSRILSCSLAMNDSNVRPFCLIPFDVHAARSAPYCCRVLPRNVQQSDISKRSVPNCLPRT